MDTTQALIAQTGCSEEIARRALTGYYTSLQDGQKPTLEMAVKRVAWLLRPRTEAPKIESVAPQKPRCPTGNPLHDAHMMPWGCNLCRLAKESKRRNEY
jgi:hypothetical protein